MKSRTAQKERDYETKAPFSPAYRRTPEYDILQQTLLDTQNQISFGQAALAIQRPQLAQERTQVSNHGCHHYMFISRLFSTSARERRPAIVLPSLKKSSHARVIRG